MTIQSETRLIFNIRFWLIIFMAGMVISGLTAFPIETQLALLVNHINLVPPFLRSWIQEVFAAVKTTNENYPFLSYGTDWLAFAHLVIAIAFIGPYRNPVKNIWVVEFGMIACISVIPLALIAGAIREIPFYWRLIDCSFGVLGIIPLYLCRRYIKQLEQILLRESVSYIN